MPPQASTSAATASNSGAKSSTSSTVKKSGSTGAGVGAKRAVSSTASRQGSGGNGSRGSPALNGSGYDSPGASTSMRASSSQPAPIRMSTLEVLIHNAALANPKRVCIVVVSHTQSLGLCLTINEYVTRHNYLFNANASSRRLSCIATAESPELSHNSKSCNLPCTTSKACPMTQMPSRIQSIRYCERYIFMASASNTVRHADRVPHPNCLHSAYSPWEKLRKESLY